MWRLRPIQHDPFREMQGLLRRMDEVFGEYRPNAPLTQEPAGAPGINLFDSGKALVLVAQVPGLTEEDIQIDATAESIAIAGRGRQTAPEGYAVQRRERRPVDLARSFVLPSRIDVEQVSAVLQNGELTLTMPKQPEHQPKQIQVKTS